VLNYTNGSPCTTPSRRHNLRRDDIDLPPSLQDPRPRRPRPLLSPKPAKLIDDDDETSTLRRKNTIISLLCEREPLAAKAAVSFIGASPDECTYFFEARTSAACPAVNVEKQQLGPGAVFGVM